MSDTATVSVQASGTPEPTCQWVHDGADIPGGAHTFAVKVSTKGKKRYQWYRNGDPHRGEHHYHRATRGRHFLTGAEGVGSTDNFGATEEGSEPRHNGMKGQRSVWVSWIAPFSGVASFSTAGSNLDTLLAVYTKDGQSVGTVSQIVSNDDWRLAIGE